MCLSLTFSSSFLLFWAVREKSTSEAEIRPLPSPFAVASIFELFFSGEEGGKGAMDDRRQCTRPASYVQTKHFY